MLSLSLSVSLSLSLSLSHVPRRYPGKRLRHVFVMLQCKAMDILFHDVYNQITSLSPQLVLNIRIRIWSLLYIIIYHSKKISNDLQNDIKI